MQGTNRTIRRVIRLLLVTALVAAVTLIAGAAAAKRVPSIKGASTEAFPQYVHGTSVAIASDGTPWFGISTAEGTSIAHLKSGKLEIRKLRKEDGYAATGALRFDSRGALWFATQRQGVTAIARLGRDGTVTEVKLPKGPPVSALTFGPEGDIWFVREGYEEKGRAEVGRMTPAGNVAQFPLDPGADPTSIALGPDGALWFNEEGTGKIGRITTGGEIQLFPLAPKVQPRQIVAGPDGAMWFGENARARRYGRLSNRIGRITVDGQVSELPVPFGKGTATLVSDPQAGVIWFVTEEGEFSSIAPSGNVGAVGCVGECGDPIVSLAQAPGGALWFAAGHATCLMCGGGSALINDSLGTTVGEIPAGALTPADPDGPPAVDPNADLTDHPPAPIARTEKAREVEGSFAVLQGYINSLGYPTTWLFRWGRTKKYGHKTFLPEYPFGAEQGAARIGEEVLGLCPGTTYHFEIVAFGPGGHTPGGDRSFRTPRAKRVPDRCLAR